MNCSKYTQSIKMNNISPFGSLLVFGTCIFAKMSYSYGTYFEKSVTVKDKYVRVVDGRSLYMISDVDNQIYRIGKSIWYWKFDNAETWVSLNPNKKYNIKGYGWRIPFLHLFPNVFTVTKIE
jgi:hypothetical protein